MEYVEANDLGEAWLKVMQLVLERGKRLEGGDKIVEYSPVLVEIKTPRLESKIIEKYGDKDRIGWMVEVFLSKKKVKGWGYSYGGRIQDFNGVDQLDKVIGKLKRNKWSKSAIISFVNPPKDEYHVPCICILDFKIRGGKINTFAYFRSQDVGKKMYADLISLLHLSNKLKEELNKPIGSLTLFISSAHVYLEDVGKCEEILEKSKGEFPKIFSKKIREGICAFIVRKKENWQILILESTRGYKYTLSGGLEEGEDYIDALNRELWEEIGLKKSDIEKVIELPFVNEFEYRPGLKGKQKCFLLIVKPDIKLGISKEVKDSYWIDYDPDLEPYSFINVNELAKKLKHYLK